MNYDTFSVNREKLANIIRNTYDEMKKEKIVLIKNLKIEEELSKRVRRKFIDGFARTLEDRIIAAADLSLFKNCSEGIVFTDIGVYCGGLMFDYTRPNHTQTNFFYYNMSYVEIDKENPNFCNIFDYEGNVTRVHNGKYNPFIVKMLNKILDIYAEEHDILEKIKENEEKNVEFKTVHKDNKENIEIYCDIINEMIQNYHCYYKSKVMAPRNIKKLIDNIRREDDYDDYVAAKLFDMGLSDYVYLAYNLDDNKQNGKMHLKLSNFLTNNIDTSDLASNLFIEMSFQCLIKAYSYYELESLELLIHTIILLYDYKDYTDEFELLDSTHELLNLMIDNQYPFKNDPNELLAKLKKIMGE